MTRSELERMAKLEQRNEDLARENAELRRKQSNFTNGDASNLNGVETFFMNLVEDGKLQQMPANYDCATLKMYISHLERENAELKAQLKNHRLMTMADGTIKQLYSVEEVEHIVKERDELKARLEKAEEALTLACGQMAIISFDCQGCDNEDACDACFNIGGYDFKKSECKKYWLTQAEQRLAELKGGDKK